MTWVQEEQLLASGFPPRRVAGRNRGWYRGDCHVHSRRSNGGELTPKELANDARAVGLDFIAATEHNTTDGHADWAAGASDDLLVIMGQEVTTATGHWLALGLHPGRTVDWQYRVRDAAIALPMAEVHRAGGLCVAAHPHAPYVSGTFMYSYDEFDAVEVWNGLWTSGLPWNADNQAALAEWGRGLAAGICTGRWGPAVGSSDTHAKGQIGSPHTVVLAEGLFTGAILAGLRAGRSWIAESPSIELTLKVSAGDRTEGIGDTLQTFDQATAVYVALSGVPAGEVSFHTDQGKVHSQSLPDSGSSTISWRTSAEESAFVRIEVRHSDGRVAALTNPVILT